MTKIGTVALLQEIIFRSYVDLVHKRRGANRVDNAFIQEAKSLHPNTAFSDIGSDFRSDINQSAEALLGYITQQGFKLVPNDK